MAHEKQHWKDALHAAQQEGDRQDDSVDPRETKKKSRLMYRRRKIDKDIKKLLKQDIITYKEITQIHDRYGITCY